MKTINEVFRDTVRAQVAAGNHSRWGEAESVATIKAVVKAAAMESGLDEIEATAIVDNCHESIKRVVNPAAFANLLEKLEPTHPSYVCRPKKGTRGSISAAAL